MTDPAEAQWIEQQSEEIFQLADDFYAELGRGAVGFILANQAYKPVYFEQNWPRLQPEIKQEIDNYQPGAEVVVVMSRPNPQDVNVYLLARTPDGSIIQYLHRV